MCVIGAGLIGGSLLRAAEKAGRAVWGTAASDATAAEARADGFDVTTDTDAALRRAADVDALVVLAVPLPALPARAGPGRRGGPDRAAHRRRERQGGGGRRGRAPRPPRTVRRRASDGGDVGVGVVGGVGGALRGRRPGSWRPTTGWTSTSGATWPSWRGRVGRGGARGGRRARPRCGAHLAPAAPVRGRAGRGRRRGTRLALSLAAGSFADGTRVAGTRPELVLAMCEGNRDALLAAVDDALGRLGAMRGALALHRWTGRHRARGPRGPGALGGGAAARRRARAAHRRCPAGEAARHRPRGEGRHRLGLTPPAPVDDHRLAHEAARKSGAGRVVTRPAWPIGRAQPAVAAPAYRPARPG